MGYKIHYKDELEHGGFKYIDKYFKNGKWQYVYEETKDKVKGAAQKVADTAKNVVTTKKYVGTDANSKRVDPDGSKGKAMGAAFTKGKVASFWDGKQFDNKGASDFLWKFIDQNKKTLFWVAKGSDYGKTLELVDLRFLVKKIEHDMSTNYKNRPEPIVNIDAFNELSKLLDKINDYNYDNRAHGGDPRIKGHQVNVLSPRTRNKIMEKNLW